MTEKRKLALITGATSGIGKASAQIFAKNNIDLILCGRRKERLNALKEELSPFVNVETTSFDVKNRQAVFDSLSPFTQRERNIDILLNNAGNAHGLSPFDEGNLDDFDEMIDANVKGLYNVTKAILPQMINHKEGHIINIGSIAGKEVYPNGNAYCASKFAVEALSKAMRIDLLHYGIKVSAIHPGLVNTEFSLVRFKGDQEKADSAYKGLTPLSADDVADAIYFMVSRPKHINIADLTIFPLAQGSSMHTHRK